MPDSQEHSPGEDYFNDLAQQPSSNQPDDERRASQDDNGQVPKTKRIACVLCRKRKLRCDGNKPSCATCKRLQHECSYDEVRRKSGPKRGYVKALEARLAQVETLLKTQDEQPLGNPGQDASGQRKSRMDVDGIGPDFGNIAIGGDNVNMLQHEVQARSRHDFPPQMTNPTSMPGAVSTSDLNITSEEPFPWEMIGLGLDEPLPNQDVVDELNQAYFEKVHPSLPMINRPRYYAAMNLAPHMRPPVCLRYAMWCNAAAVTDKYEALQEHFYARARKYIQSDEMKGHGESMITIAHCQTWTLLATHEFKLMYFPRAWMSAGRACRLSQMMGLHRLDNSGLDVKQCLPPAKDWVEREERRRTFWMAFCVDRYSSIGTGWPMTLEENDIHTTLPSDEESFEFNKPVTTIHLSDALNPSGSMHLSSFAGVALMACLFGRNLTHLHRPGPDDNDDDLNGEFWKRHRAMDNILLGTALSLPDPLRLPNGRNNPNIVFLNMNIHTSTICLHQAAIFKADKNRMPARISAESKVRCITAAAEIASIMRQISHLDLSAMNPFISFCLYVAARVFVQYLKSRPKDAQVKASVQFLLSAMHAIKRKNPLTESFLVQLDVDLQGAGLDYPSKRGSTVSTTAQPCNVGHAPLDPLPARHPTYGDHGLATYTNPVNSSNAATATTTTTTSQADLFTYPSSSMAAEPVGLFQSEPTELPIHHRSPGSNQSSGIHRSPQSYHPDMDTSPDGSGATENRTPSSSYHASSHTSNTACTPPVHHTSTTLQTDNHAAFLDATNFSDFDMQNFPHTTAEASHQAGFVLPQEDWSGPSSSAAQISSPGILRGDIGDMMNMNDADWNQVMDSLSGWESNMMPHDSSMLDTLRGR